MSLTKAELEKVFDFLELKRGEKLGCSICGGNEWSGRKLRNIETDAVKGPEVGTTYVQLICANCKHVVSFTDKVLDGPW